jgi:predicted phosphodiesterase
MKLAITSDVHLEFADLDIVNSESADVLILAGDICVAADILDLTAPGFMGLGRSTRIREFFTRCASEFQDVILIMGNHEHYHGDFATTQSRLQTMLTQEGLNRVHLLEKSSVTIKGVIFSGGTLWTDMNRSDPDTMIQIADAMNDFRQIENSNRTVSYRAHSGNTMTTRTRPGRLTPTDVVVDHSACLEYFESVVDSQPTATHVIVGHHAPSALSVHSQYAGQHAINGGYRSNLDSFIQQRPQIRLWCHGHTHHDFDYMIGATRVVCNPRGYKGYEARADEWQLKYVDI